MLALQRETQAWCVNRFMCSRVPRSTHLVGPGSVCVHLDTGESGGVHRGREGRVGWEHIHVDSAPKVNQFQGLRAATQQPVHLGGVTNLRTEMTQKKKITHRQIQVKITTFTMDETKRP